MMTEDDIIHVVSSEDLFAIEEDLFVSARESFNFKEFEKTAFILRECRSPKSRFLCLYSKYLVSRGNSAVGDGECVLICLSLSSP